MCFLALGRVKVRVFPSKVNIYHWSVIHVSYVREYIDIISDMCFLGRRNIYH